MITKKPKNEKTPKVRIMLQYSGKSAESILEAASMLGIGAPSEVVRYLAQRGLEAMSHQLQARRLMLDMQHKLDPQEMLDLALKMEKGGKL